MIAVTHNGIFHADEVFAIALLQKFYGITLHMNEEQMFMEVTDQQKRLDVIRTRANVILTPALKNKNIYVVDVGGELDNTKCNYDHHQNRNLVASNMLVLEDLYITGRIDTIVFYKINKLMKGVSNMDCNVDSIHKSWSKWNDKGLYKNLSSILTGFNRNPGNETAQNRQFALAVEFAVQILDNEEYRAVQEHNAKVVYASKKVLTNNVAVFDEYCAIWKEKDEHMFVVQPNSQGWSVTSKDSSKYPLMEASSEDLIFLHKNLFVAVFKTKTAAIEYASEL